MLLPCTILNTAWVSPLSRRIRGSGESIGTTCICILRRTALSYATRRIHVTLMMTSQPRYAAKLPKRRVLLANPVKPKPLAPANGAPADATRDPLLRDKVHGQHILEVRKALAFAGFTHKSPRVISYERADRIVQPVGDGGDAPIEAEHGPERGRSPMRSSGTVGRGRAISM